MERKIAIELDGGQHADNMQYDKARTVYLERGGYCVLRFWNNEVFDSIEGVVEVILSKLVQRVAPSLPNPPLEGEG